MAALLRFCVPRHCNGHVYEVTVHETTDPLDSRRYLAHIERIERLGKGGLETVTASLPGTFGATAVEAHALADTVMRRWIQGRAEIC